MLNNRDVPGVVGRVGTLLGQHGINIAGLELGREKAGGMAISFVHVDEAVPEAVLAELRRSPDILAAQLLPALRPGMTTTGGRRRPVGRRGQREVRRHPGARRRHRRALSGRQQRGPHARRRQRAHRAAPDPVGRPQSGQDLRHRQRRGGGSAPCSSTSSWRSGSAAISPTTPASRSVTKPTSSCPTTRRSTSRASACAEGRDRHHRTRHWPGLRGQDRADGHPHRRPARRGRLPGEARAQHPGEEPLPESDLAGAGTRLHDDLRRVPQPRRPTPAAT